MNDPIPLHAGNPGLLTGEGNWTWLVRGRAPALVDAGVGDPRQLDALDRALDGAALACVLVTHAHADHASGVTAIAARHPGAQFLKTPWRERDARWQIAWTPIGDGDHVEAGDTVLKAIHTPGHAPDHLCFWHEQTRTLFGGDLVIRGTTVYIPAAPGGDMAAYVESLERVLALKAARILPAHGPVIDDPESMLSAYIAHRHEREDQVIDALRRGDRRVEAIVARVYRDLHSDLLARAHETVLAHLRKLERDGRAGRRGDLWYIV